MHPYSAAIASPRVPLLCAPPVPLLYPSCILAYPTQQIYISASPTVLTAALGLCTLRYPHACAFDGWETTPDTTRGDYRSSLMTGRLLALIHYTSRGTTRQTTTDRPDAFGGYKFRAGGTTPDLSQAHTNSRHRFLSSSPPRRLALPPRPLATSPTHHSPLYLVGILSLSGGVGAFGNRGVSGATVRAQQWAWIGVTRSQGGTLNTYVRRTPRLAHVAPRGSHMSHPLIAIDLLLLSRRGWRHGHVTY